MNAYFGVGAAQGLDAGVRRHASDMMLEEDRKAAQEERTFQRGRQMAADGRADEQLAYEKSQRGTKERAAQLSLESAEENLAGARTDRAYQGQDRLTQSEDRNTANTYRANQETREKGRYDMTRQQFKAQVEEMQAKMKDEGFEDLLDALEGGANPEYAFQKFNAKGKLGIRPGTGKYDPSTKTISGISSTGQPFNGPIANLRALIPKGKPAAIKLGENERLVRPGADGSFKDVTPTPGKGGAAPRGQYREKFNWQSHINQAEDQVFKVMGGRFNTMTQEYDPPEGGGDKVGLAQEFVGNLGRRLEESGVKIESGELGNIAGQIVRDIVVTIGDAQKQVAADPKFKNAGDEAIRTEVQSIVKDSKIKAKIAIDQEFNNLVRQSQAAQDQNEDLPADKPSADIQDPQTQAGPPDIKYLREGKRFDRKDGTYWTLKGGQPIQVDRQGREQSGGATGRW